GLTAQPVVREDAVTRCTRADRRHTASSSRRELLRRAAAFAVGAPLFGLLARPGPALAAAPSSAAATASLVVALPADPASLNPLLQTGLVEASAQMNI